MWQLATAFAEVALRRRGPESLPDSNFLVLALLAACLFLTLIDLALIRSLTGPNLALLGATTVLQFAFVFAVLAFFKLERRFRQTISAMLGVDICITLAYMPFTIGGLALRLEFTEFTFLWWLRVGFVLWSIFIAASILARSLSQPFLIGLMFEILFVLTSLSIGDLLFPAAS